MGDVPYDYIVVGGGLSGCVVASRLSQYEKNAKILLIEAGPDTRTRTDILRIEAINLGGSLDWMYPTEPIRGISNRTLVYNSGKGLGGGTVINSGGWMRGSAKEFDEWGALVGDERWSYNGQLPWMKKSESWFDDKNPEQHGSDGPMQISSVESTNRRYPLREPLASGWDELGVPVLPNLDNSAGDNFGRANLTEARRNGLRQTAATAYPLEGVTLLTDTLVKKVVLDRDGSTPKASGVELADGTIIKSKNVILSAGSLRSPQLLMLSGIGPSAHLKDVGVEPAVDLPEVGQGLTDHMSFFQHWKVRDENEGLTLGSNNPMLVQPEMALGIPTDFLVNTDVPKAGLAEAIEKDEGVQPDMKTHPLLCQPRSFTETFVTYVKIPFPGTVPDTHHITSDVVSFLPTSRGSITLRSANHEDTPRIDFNYLATETDKYVYREALRQITRLMLDTEFGKKYIVGESVPEGIEPLALGDSDEKLDMRLALTGAMTWHATGSCSMGKVIDTEFQVRGVEGLRVVDGSAVPVPLSTHVQAPLFAMSEQAAAIIAGKA